MAPFFQYILWEDLGFKVLQVGELFKSGLARLPVVFKGFRA